MSLVSPTPMVNYFGYLFNGANWHLDRRLVDPGAARPAHRLHPRRAADRRAIALPLGLFIGHTNRGAFIAIGLGNLGRSLPTFGLVLLLVIFLGVYIWPVLLALVVLAIHRSWRRPTPASGPSTAPPSTPRSAWACGRCRCCSRPRCRWRCPLIIGGLRSALLQVVRDGHHRGLRQLRWSRSAADRRAEPQPVRPGPRRRPPGRPARDRPGLRQRRRRARRGLPGVREPAAPAGSRAAVATDARRVPAEESPVSARR